MTVTARWLPLVFGLRANFPNPFNPSTTIGYSLPTDVKVRLAIFDVQGQKVGTWCVKSSRRDFTWPSGTAATTPATGWPRESHSYKLEARGGGDGSATTEFSEVRKLMLVK